MKSLWIKNTICSLFPSTHENKDCLTHVHNLRKTINKLMNPPKDDEDDEKAVEENKSNPPLNCKDVMVVVNHCDSNEREVGTDTMLKYTQNYGFGMFELSSTSGVNLDCLIHYIINRLVDEHRHEEMKSIDVIRQYETEHKDAIKSLKEMYGSTVEVVP
jgi:GTPase involved in cell partitioning and DNA repair